MSNIATKPGRVPSIDDNVAATRPADVIRLLAEYTLTFRRLAKQSRALVERQVLLGGGYRDKEARYYRDKNEYQATMDAGVDVWLRFRKLGHVATDLARYASGLIEGVRLDKVTVLELRLRNAELEAAIEAAGYAMGQLDAPDL